MLGDSKSVLSLQAFIATVDAPEIYMQQFWYTVAYDLTTKAHFFKIDDQIFEVNADLIRNALQITPKDPNHPFTLPAPEKEIISFINKLGCSKTIKTISALRTNNMFQTCRTFVTMLTRFTNLIIKYILSQNDQISKRSLSFHHVIKLDSTLGNIKFANKGIKDPVFGKAIPDVMLNDDIKASAKYSKYLEKSKGSKPIKATCRGKGFLTNQGVEIAVKSVSIPKRRRLKIVVEEVDKSEEVVDDDVDSNETQDDKEEPLVRRRPTGVVIGGEARKESDEERVDHSKNMQGIEIGSGEGSAETPKVPDELNQKGSNEGSGVTLAVLDEPRDSLSGYSSEDEIEDISSDKEDKRDDDKEKADESQKADEEILATDRIDDEKAEEEHVEKQGGNEQDGITQTDFLNDNPDVTVNEVLKDSVKPKVQSMVDIPIQQVKLAEQRPPLPKLIK
ncbi:hypothetical protein Tco_0191289 [Tanacetum coccineum]